MRVLLMERQWKLTVRDAGLVRGRVIQVSAAQPPTSETEVAGSVSAASGSDCPGLRQQ